MAKFVSASVGMCLHGMVSADTAEPSERPKNLRPNSRNTSLKVVKLLAFVNKFLNWIKPMANNEQDTIDWDKEEKLQKRRDTYKSRKQVKEGDLKLEQFFGLPKYRPNTEQ